MAKMMVPRENCRSDGERLIFDFMESHISDDFMIWNNVEFMHTQPNGTVFESEIDFIIHQKEVGILLMEEKDWRISHLREITKDVVVKTNGIQEGNPARILKIRSYHIMSKLSSHPELCYHRRRLKCWIDNALCLPYITEKQWCERFNSWSINPDDVCLPAAKILFKKDFENGSPLANSTDMFMRLSSMRGNRNFGSHFNKQDLMTLDNILRVPTSETITEIVYINRSDFRNSFLEMRGGGGQRQLAAEKLKGILDSSHAYNELHNMSSYEDTRIRNCVIYNISEISRLVTIHHDGVVYMCFIGDLQNTEQWVGENRSTVVTIDTETQRVSLTRVTGELMGSGMLN